MCQSFGLFLHCISHHLWILKIMFNKISIKISTSKCRMLQNIFPKIQCCFHTRYLIIINCFNRSVHCLFSIFTPNNKFSNHRIVINWNFHSFKKCIVYTNIFSCRNSVAIQCSNIRRKTIQ